MVVSARSAVLDCQPAATPNAAIMAQASVRPRLPPGPEYRAGANRKSPRPARKTSRQAHEITKKLFFSANIQSRRANRGDSHFQARSSILISSYQS
jgi:hypothetical protein